MRGLQKEWESGGPSLLPEVEPTEQDEIQRRGSVDILRVSGRPLPHQPISTFLTVCYNLNFLPLKMLVSVVSSCQVRSPSRVCEDSRYHVQKGYLGAKMGAKTFHQLTWIKMSTY